MSENDNLNQDPPEGGDLDGDRATPDPETGGAPDPEGGQPKTETKAEDKPVSREEYKKLAGRLAYAERELRRRDTEAPHPAGAGEQPPETGPTRPKPARADFEDYDDWRDAVGEWQIEQRDHANSQKVQESTAQQKRIDRQKKYEEMTAAETAKDPDFLKKAFIPIGPLEDFILESDQMVNLALHFGASRENTMEAMRLSDLAKTNPAAAAREIGRLEAKLQNKSPTPRTNTNAPNVTKQLGSGTETANKKPEDMTQAEYNAWRDAGGGKD